MRIFAGILFSMVTVIGAAAADNRAPLTEDPTLNSGLQIVAESYFMRKNCDEIGVRVFRSWSFVRSLKARANEMGYSDEEIKRYFDDKDQKAVFEGAAKRRLESLGVDFDDPHSFCPVAHAEIAAERGFGRFFYSY